MKGERSREAEEAGKQAGRQAEEQAGKQYMVCEDVKSDHAIIKLHGNICVTLLLAEWVRRVQQQQQQREACVTVMSSASYNPANITRHHDHHP